MADKDPTPLKPVEDQEQISPEVQAAIDLESAKLSQATMTAQINYLGTRLADLVRENLELKNEIETLKNRRK